MKARVLPWLLCLIPGGAFGQLVVNSTMTPTQLVQNVLLGSGVSVSNVTFNGLPGNSVNLQCAYFDGSACNIGMPAGVMLSSGECVTAIGPNNQGGQTLPPGGFGGPGDADLSQACGYGTMDRAILEFDFVPNGDTLRFNYVFGSEEYMEWAYPGSQYNDVFGFFLSGPGIAGPYSNGAANIAVVPGLGIPVTIQNVNLNVNNTFYVDNGDGYTAPMNVDSTYIQFDGFTVLLEAFAIVQCGQQYHIKLAMADGTDPALDSGVFLEAGSFTSTAAVTASMSTAVGLIDSTLYEGCAEAVLAFTRYAGFNTVDTVQLVVAGTATNGVDFLPPLPPEIIFQIGDTTINYILTAPIDVDLLEFVDVTISNVAQCSGQIVVTNFSFYINEAQPMYITVQDTTIDCDDIITVGPQVFQGYGSYGYIWSTGDNTPTITISPPVTTTYTVTVTDTCGMVPQTASFTVTVPVYPPVDITVSNDTSIACLQNAVLAVTSVTGGDGFYTYEWTDANGNVLSTNPTLNVTSGPPAWYYVEVGAGCGQGDTDSVLVSPLTLPPIVVTTNNDSTVVCPGDPMDLLVLNTTGGNGVYTYTWTDANLDTISTGTSVPVLVTDTTTYWIHVDDQCGNTGLDSITVFTPQYEPFELFLAADTAICLGTPGTLWVMATGGARHNLYDWPTLNSIDTLIVLSPTAAESYPVTVTDQCGSQLSGAIFMDVQDVTAQFYVNYSSEYDVSAVSLSQGNISEYLWDFGDGDQATTQHSFHHYTDTDDHDLWLTVWNPIGCVDSTSILVQPVSHLYVPNAFSPDGDGVNDDFAPLGHDLSSYELSIFDRWGAEIFTTTDPGKPWDGKVDGAAPMNGVYVWKLRATGLRFGPVEYVGSVALIK